jgi:hypothetical protein
LRMGILGYARMHIRKQGEIVWQQLIADRLKELRHLSGSR